MTYARSLPLLILLFACTPAMAETMYVTDVLRLNLQSTSESGSKKVCTITSGQELKVLEKQRNYTKVRTRDGVTGWAKSAYLVTEPPASHRVAQLENGNRSLSSRLESLQKKFDTLQEEANQLQDAQGTASNQVTQQKEQIRKLSEENQEFREQLSTYHNSVSLSVLGGAIILCLIMGFTAGIALIDYRSRKRHGGFRIY